MSRPAQTWPTWPSMFTWLLPYSPYCCCCCCFVWSWWPKSKWINTCNPAHRMHTWWNMRAQTCPSIAGDWDRRKSRTLCSPHSLQGIQFSQWRRPKQKAERINCTTFHHQQRLQQVLLHCGWGALIHSQLLTLSCYTVSIRCHKKIVTVASFYGVVIPWLFLFHLLFLFKIFHRKKTLTRCREYLTDVRTGNYE